MQVKCVHFVWFVYFYRVDVILATDGMEKNRGQPHAAAEVGTSLRDHSIGYGFSWFHVRLYDNESETIPLPVYWQEYTQTSAYGQLRGRQRTYYMSSTMTQFDNARQLHDKPAVCNERVYADDIIKMTTEPGYDEPFPLSPNQTYTVYFYCGTSGFCCDIDCCAITAWSMIRGILLILVIMILAAIIIGTCIHVLAQEEYRQQLVSVCCCRDWPRSRWSVSGLRRRASPQTVGEAQQQGFDDIKQDSYNRRRVYGDHALETYDASPKINPKFSHSTHVSNS